MTPKKISGFTLIELLVVISIIGVLASGVAASVSQARRSAQYARVQAEIRALAHLVEFARSEQNKTLTEISGGTCTECTCRSGPLPVTINIQTLPTTGTCHTSYRNLIALLNLSTGGLYQVIQPPLDPWGAPYLINENEGEVQSGGTCGTDNITSAGPNGLYYDTDDVNYNIPTFKCTNSYSHHPNINW